MMHGKSDYIDEDKRTVGMVMSVLDFAEEARGLRFSTTDLAGQAVNGVANQFFLVRRAIFAVVWRVLPRAATEGEVSKMVSKWLVS
jgi:hypothetical protein